MNKKYLLVVDTDPEFKRRFSKRLKIHKLHEEYEIENISPDTTLNEKMVPKAVEKVSKFCNSGKNIAGIFVDIVVIESGGKIDTFGVKIANELKQLLPDIPIFNITGKPVHNEMLDIYSDTTMENNDGVFVKQFLDGEDFDVIRLNKILNTVKTRKSIVPIPYNNSQRIDNDEYDVAIITALYEDEFENIKSLCSWQTPKEDATKIFHVGEFCSENTNSEKAPIKVVAIHQHETGMVDAAIFATEIVNKYKPKFLVMTGVCGGKDDEDLAFGDIVVARNMFTFQKGKETENSFEKENQTCEIDQLLLQKIKENKMKILRKIMDEDTSRKYDNKQLKMHLEPMACGTIVINKEGYFEKQIEPSDRKTIAVDMESYAIARACKIANEGKTKAIIIKSIMDKTKAKTDDEKSYASYTSARFLKFLISDVLFPQV